MIALLALATAPISAPTLLATIARLATTAECSRNSPCEGEAEAVKYRFWGVDSVTFDAGERWSFSISKDEFTDEISCLLNNMKPGFGPPKPELRLYMDYEIPGVSIGTYPEKAFPGTLNLYRVDSNPVLSAVEGKWLSDPRTKKLLAQMMAGSGMKIAYEVWPTKYRSDSYIDLTGFAAIYRTAKALCSIRP